MVEAHHHVGHLYTGVVDVVLHLDFAAGGAEHAHEGVAQNRVAHMPDVRGLVRVDVGVLDDDLAGGCGGGLHVAGEQSRTVRRSIQAQVDVAVAGDLRARDALDGRHFGQNLGGDHTRRFTKLASQREGRGDAQLAEAGLLGRLDNYLRFNAIADFQIRRYTLGDALFDVMEH